MNASTRGGLAIFGIILGLVGLTFGIFNTAQTRQITYRKVEKSYVSISIQEFGQKNELVAYYLELTDGSIFYLNLIDFPESPKLPDIHENDAISLVYDANTKQKIDASPTIPSLDLGGGPDPHIKGDGYQIVQFTFGYPNLTGQPSGQAVKSYASNDYLQHPNSYYRNNWVSLTGGGLLAVSIIITLACSFVLYRALREEHFERRYKRINSGYTIEAWRYKR